MPYPDGRQTPAERRYWQCRGPLGIHVLTGTGQASPYKVTREMARALWGVGKDVSVEAPGQEQGWTRTSVRHLEGLVKSPYATLHWGRHAHHYDGFAGQTYIEMDAIDTFRWAYPVDIEFINDRVDMLVVPAEDSEQAFRKAGVTIPIAVVPYGVDTNVYRRWPRDEKLLDQIAWVGGKRRGESLFLTGGFVQPRKGLSECIQAFKLACDEGMEASLVVLCNTQSHGRDVSEMVRVLAGEYPIGLMPGSLSEWAMARLYSSVDCFVSCHRLEGFGLMPLESMACGTPAILTDYGGPQAYSGYGGCYVVQPEGVHNEPMGPGIEVDAAVISVRGVANAMMAAQSDVFFRMFKGIGMFSWDRAAMKLCEGLEAAGFDLRRGHDAMQIANESRVIYAPSDKAEGWQTPLWPGQLPGMPPTACFATPPSTMAGFSPHGLEAVDLILWKMAHGAHIVKHAAQEIDALPPWWDGADSEAEANERLANHVLQFNFWWADLIEHIERTGWWQ